MSRTEDGRAVVGPEGPPLRSPCDGPATAGRWWRWVRRIAVATCLLAIAVAVTSRTVDWELRRAEWNGCSRAAVEAAREVRADAARDIPGRTSDVRLGTGKECGTGGRPSVSVTSDLEAIEVLRVLTRTWSCDPEAVYVYERGGDVSCSTGGRQFGVYLYPEVDAEPGRRTTVVLDLLLP